jgi:hypothetical protein
MENRTIESNDILLEEPRRLPETLNVLTILTFIGCGLGYISAIYGFFSASNYQAQMDKIRDAQDKLGDGAMSKWMAGSMEMLQRTHDYRYIMLAVGLVFTTLCLVGALQMRKLRKSGFTIYAIGELTPILISVILLGFSITSAVSMGFGLVVALVFVILYANQRKYMVNE